MKLETVITLLQYCGTFPVSYYVEGCSLEKELSPQMSWKFLCCTVLQFLLTVWRANIFIQYMSVAPPELLLSIVIAAFYLTSTALAVLQPMSNIKSISKCIQLGNNVANAANFHQNINTFSSLIFINFCIQTGSSVLILAQYIQLFKSLEILRSDVQSALLSLTIFDSIFVENLVNYCVQIVLKIILVSYTKINHHLSLLSDGKSENVTSKEIEVLDTQHWKTGDLLDLLNNTFSFQIFIFGSATFAKLTLLYYFVTVTEGIWSVTFGEHPNLFYALYLSVYTIAALLLDILTLCVASQQVNTEIRKTCVLLSRLLRKQSDKITHKIVLQVRVFLYQVKSRQLEVTGCGLFFISKNFFYIMVMQIVAYIILLLQFKLFQ